MHDWEAQGPCLECGVQLCYDCTWTCTHCSMPACPLHIPHSSCGEAEGIRFCMERQVRSCPGSPTRSSLPVEVAACCASAVGKEEISCPRKGTAHELPVVGNGIDHGQPTTSPSASLAPSRSSRASSTSPCASLASLCDGRSDGAGARTRVRASRADGIDEDERGDGAGADGRDDADRRSDGARAGASDEILDAGAIFISTGSHAFRLPGRDFNILEVFDSDTISTINRIPRHVLIQGGGILGIEFASMLGQAGTKITLVEMTSVI